MESKQFNILKATERVEAYCATHPIASPPSGYPVLVAALGDTLAQLRAHVVAQRAETQAALGETQRQDALAERVRREQLMPARRIAMAWLKDVPEIEARFHVPPPQSGRRAVAVAVRAMAVNAAAYGDLLITHGRPADFIAQMTAAADEIEQGITESARKVGARSKATEGIVAEIQRAGGIVRQIDAVLRNAYAADPAALAEWRAARRITQVTTRRAAGRPPNGSGEVGASTSSPSDTTPHPTPVKEVG